MIKSLIAPPGVQSQAGCRRGLDWGVMITQTVTARRNVVSGVRGSEAPPSTERWRRVQNEQEVQHREPAERQP